MISMFFEIVGKDVLDFNGAGETELEMRAFRPVLYDEFVEFVLIIFFTKPVGFNIYLNDILIGNDNQFGYVSLGKHIVSELLFRFQRLCIWSKLSEKLETNECGKYDSPE